MSLSNEQNFEKYSPSVPTTEFDWGIPYFDNTDVAVDVEASDGVITSLTLNASTNGFTVAATNGDKRLGATITTTEAYDDGDNITISRQVPYTQEYDLKNGQAINATNLNKAFDRTVAQSQQIVEQVGRQLEHPITDQDGLSYEAPAVVDRASKAAGWDASGNVVALNLASSGTIAGDGTKGIDVTNNIISAKVDGAGIDFDLNGEMVIKDGGVITDKLGNASVTTEKILDENITTATIADSNVTFPKVDFVIDDDTMATATDTNVPTSESVKAYVDTAGSRGYMHVRDEKASGTNGGAFTSGDWRTRDLNVVKTNTISGASLSANQITLPVGTYRVRATAPALNTATNKAKIRNISNSSDSIIGSSEMTGSVNHLSTSTVIGSFVLVSESIIELQHRCFTTNAATSGFGLASNLGVVEVYSEIEIWKIG